MGGLVFFSIETGWSRRPRVSINGSAVGRTNPTFSNPFMSTTTTKRVRTDRSTACAPFSGRLPRVLDYHVFTFVTTFELGSLTECNSRVKQTVQAFLAQTSTVVLRFPFTHTRCVRGAFFMMLCRYSDATIIHGLRLVEMHCRRLQRFTAVGVDYENARPTMRALTWLENVIRNNQNTLRAFDELPAVCEPMRDETFALLCFCPHLQSLSAQDHESALPQLQGLLGLRRTITELRVERQEGQPGDMRDVTWRIPSDLPLRQLRFEGWYSGPDPVSIGHVGRFATLEDLTAPIHLMNVEQLTAWESTFAQLPNLTRLEMYDTSYNAELPEVAVGAKCWRLPNLKHLVFRSEFCRGAGGAGALAIAAPQLETLEWMDFTTVDDFVATFAPSLRRAPLPATFDGEWRMVYTITFPQD
jgi:hypothetical protein